MTDTKAWLQEKLDISRARLDEALTLDDEVPAVRLTQYKLRQAFSAGAVLIFAAQYVPYMEVDDAYNAPLDEAPDLTEGHAVLGLPDDVRTLTRALQHWDDWLSYVELDKPPPCTLEGAAAWVRTVQHAFVARFALQ